MAKWATITDDFPGSSLSSLWEGSYGSHTVSGNRVGQATVGYHGINSVNHDLSESSVMWKNEPDTSGGYTGGTIRRASGGTTIMTTYYKHGTPATLEVEYDNGGTASSVSLTYSATDHLWIRFRHTGSTVYCDTAPDGNTWTNRHSGACTATEANTVDLQLEAGEFPSTGSGTGYQSKLNLAPAAGGPVALAGSSSGTSTAAGSLGLARPLAGTGAGAGTGTGTLSNAVPMAGTAAGSSTASGALDVTRALAGTSAGAGGADGALGVEQALAGTAAGVGGASGTLAAPTQLAGTGAGVGGATGTLATTRTLQLTAWRYVLGEWHADDSVRAWMTATPSRAWAAEDLVGGWSASPLRRGWQAKEPIRES